MKATTSIAMKKRSSILALTLLLAGGTFGGCSKQAPSDPGAGVGETADEGTERGGRDTRREEREPEPELTPEQLEARRVAQAEQKLNDALDAYTSDNPNLESIEAMLEEVLDELPNNPEAWFNLGVVRYDRGDINAARDAWTKAGEVDSTFARGMANLGMLELEAGNESEAIDIFERCLERSSTEPGCNINLAILYRRDALADGTLTSAEAQRSIDRLRFALGGDARNAEAYDHLARVYYDLGQLDLAQLVCENAILQGMDNAVLHNRLGLIALAKDDVIRAYREFQAAVARDPELIDAWMNIGAMALSFRDYDTASNAFQTVLELRPGWNEAKMSYGVALRGQGQIDSAKAQYEEVLAEEPGNLAAIFNLGVLYQEGVQDYERALEYYRDYLERTDEPNSEFAQGVSQRITNLEDLIQALEEFGEM